MRGLERTRRRRSPSILIGAVVAALLLAWSAVPVQAADARLETAQQKRAAVQQRLDAVLQRLDEVQARTAKVRDRVTDLKQQARQQGKAARAADRRLVGRVRDAYKRGQTPAVLAMFGTSGPAEATERARVLALLAGQHREDTEVASAARSRVAATAQQVSRGITVLQEHEAELASVREQVQQALTAAQAEEDRIRRTIAAAQAARERAARERAARQQAAAVSAPAEAQPAAGGGGGGGAPVSGGIACPVGTPRSYSDTYGAPRSGGRSHKGTDILAPHGTPSYAYESGTILRTNSSSLGGISLYMRGDSGNVYYYTHLAGYAGAGRAGARVSAGTLIAYVGDTGNAAGIPHLHFEVMPGGGGNVNPYPYVLRACG